MDQRKLKQTAILIQFENKIKQIDNALLAKEITEDDAEEQKAIARIDFLSGFDASLDLGDSDTMEKVYENVLYDALTDSVHRMLGYSNAMDKYEKDIMQFNSNCGDLVLDFKRNDTEQSLEKLWKIYFMRQIGVNIGLTTEDIDRIVNNLIDNLFKVRV